MFFKYKSKKIVIIGINELSIFFANKMSKENDIILLDKDYENEYSELDLILDSIDSDLLSTYKKYGVREALFLITMTNNDEYNLFASNLAKECGTEKTISMVKNMNYINLSFADMIFNPYQLIVNQIESKINEKNINNIKNFIPGKVDLIEILIKEKSIITNKKIKNINLHDGLIIGIKRKKEVKIANPNTIIYPGDKLIIIYKKGNINKVLKQLSNRIKVKEKVFIIGGNDLAYSLAKQLSNYFQSVLIIEPDINKCNRLAEKTENFLILHGEGTEEKLLLDEGLEKSSTILALDNNDLHNILSSYLVKETGCDKVLTLINYKKYKHIANSLGLNIILLPELVYNYLHSFMNVNRDNYKNLYRSYGINILDINIENNSSAINKKVEEIQKKNEIIIALIIRENKNIITNEQDIIKANDRLIVLSHKDSEQQIYNLFR
ncbi:NAD-binding protein [Natronospora cellulosivora (SeqCode)]